MAWRVGLLALVLSLCAPSYVLAESRAILAFTTLDESNQVHDLPLDVTLSSGQTAIPAWVTGHLLRNGPGRYETPNGEDEIWHWFDGLTMIHAFTVNSTGVWYSNRYLKTNDYNSAMQTNRINFVGFGTPYHPGKLPTDPCKVLFKHFQSEFVQPLPYDVNNVNIQRVMDNFLAITDTPLAVSFDPVTLETLEDPFVWDDNLPASQASCAHPQIDAYTGDEYNYILEFGANTTFSVYHIPPGSSSRKILGTFQTDFNQGSYIHSFAMTQNYVLLAAVPLRMDIICIMQGPKTALDCFRWHPEDGTRWIVFNRTDGSLVGTRTSDAFFTFHHINARDEGNTIEVDLVGYDTPDIVNLLNLTNLLYRPSDVRNNFLKSRITRFTLQLSGSGIDQISSRPLSQTTVELPRVNPHATLKPYDYIYGVGYETNADLFDAIHKVNTKSGDKTSWHEDGCYPGEAVFVPRPNGDSEDDGVLLSVVLDVMHKNSFLLILDAKSMTEIARASIPFHVPYGFHGAFFNKLD